MKKILFITNILLLNLAAIASEVKPKPITISGYVSDDCRKVFSDTMLIYFHDHYNYLLWHEGKTIPAKIINNRFSVTIQPESQLAYFQIRDGKENKNWIPSINMDAFLISAGDEIKINFKSLKDISFSGKGSEKLTYQHFAGKIALDWGKDYKLYIERNQAQINYYKGLADEHFRIAMDSLNRIKSSRSESAFKILKYNTVAAINLYHIFHMTTLIMHKKFPAADSLYTKAVLGELKTMDQVQRSFTTTDSTVVEYSSDYINYLGEFVSTFNSVTNQSKTADLGQMFEKVIHDYSGVLRDRLLGWLIIRYNSNKNILTYLSQALNIIKDERTLARLSDMLKVNQVGTDAYDFSFEDTKGKQVKLKDLRGKLVIMEAWFNGCTGCVGLAMRMHPIIEKYKTNKNVVFISLCVDRDKKRFLDGVKSEKYGSSSSVYVYTNGVGWEHPMCLQYWSYGGYPQAVYIDKNGKIISSQKIDPVDEISKAELLKLIEQHI